MSEDFVFRRLDTRDLSELMQIERSSFDNPWSAQVMRDSLNAAHTKTWGMVNHLGKLIGYAVFSILMDEGELLSMTIHPDAQGKGCGAALLNHVLEEIKDAKVETFFLEVRSTHDAAIHLYQKLGFTQIGTRKEYYPGAKPDTRDDALIMSLSIFSQI